MSTATEPRVDLTEAAAQAIQGILGDTAESKGLRIYVEPGGCSGMSYAMEMNEKQPGDMEFVSFGTRLFVDETALTYLKGSVIDYQDTLTSSGFRIKNPNARHTCGCGTSFEA
ncbi:MAG: HesB/IscA family protein [Candidatus Methylacidiphilales bacterium]|nr:iron-sulfur cluster assembly accessory protein [Candidatus Methylacidiphilales bacterium]